MISSFCANLCRYSGKENLGYNILSQKRPLRIYGTSTLSLQGINPDWIVCYNLIKSQEDKEFCKVAHAVKIDRLEILVDDYVYDLFKIDEIKNFNPFYKVEKMELPTIVFNSIK